MGLSNHSANASGVFANAGSVRGSPLPRQHRPYQAVDASDFFSFLRSRAVIVVAVKRNADDLQPPHCGEHVIHRHIALGDLLAEEPVVDRQVRGRLELVRITRHKPSQRVPVAPDGTQLDPVVAVVPLIDDVAVHDHVGEILTLRLHTSGPDHGADRQKQQRDRRQTLLPVYDAVLSPGAIAHDLGDDAAEEMMSPPVTGNLLQVLVQLTAVIDSPIVFPLVHGNDEPLVRTLHERHQIRCRTLHSFTPPHATAPPDKRQGEHQDIDPIPSVSHL